MSIHVESEAGKVTISTLVSLVVLFVVFLAFGVDRGGHVGQANAQVSSSTATTSVTVLNTPPTWDVDAVELFESSTSSPTNVGTSTVWVGTASDANGEAYYMLVCRSSSTPNDTNPPTCNGGAGDTWGISSLTSSGDAATVTRTALVGDAERNEWYAYVCDTNLGDPECNISLSGQQAGNPTDSPFHVNHAPSFTVFTDNSPTLPGSTVTWFATATDTDSVGGADAIRLHVCRDQDFDTVNDVCGPGGFWSSSTLAIGDNPQATYTITIPTQDTDYEAWGYVVDEHGFEATGAGHDSDSTLTVENARPYVSSSTIILYDTENGTSSLDTDLQPRVDGGQTFGFGIQFTVNDDNSCEAFGGGQEIATATINVFRSDIGLDNGTGCNSAGQYNENYCYPYDEPLFGSNVSCYEVPGDCGGPGSASVTWECTFPLWYIVDPTDAGSPNPGDDWRASARVQDEALQSEYGTLSSADVAANTSSQMIQFLSFTATGSPIAYGSLTPGSNTGTLIATTTIFATGNTGLDQNLSGDAMCEDYPLPCSFATADTIFVEFQRYGTSSSGILFNNGTPLSTSSSPVEVELNLGATDDRTATSNADTYWGIEIPSNLTYAGDYLGRNFIEGVVAEAVDW